MHRSISSSTFRSPQIIVYYQKESDRVSDIIPSTVDDENSFLIQSIISAANKQMIQKQWGSVIQLCNKGLNIREDPQLYNIKGRAQGKLGNTQIRIELTRKAISLNPNCTNYYRNLGISFYKCQNFEQALTNHKKTVELEPNNSINYHNAGAALSRLKRYAQAIEMFRKSIQLQRYQAHSFRWLGNCYKQMGQNQKALQNYYKAYDLSQLQIDKTEIDKLQKCLYPWWQNYHINGQAHTQNSKEKVDAKDQIIGTMLTMRKLQKKKIIPSQIKPINLNTSQIRYTNKNDQSKYLLVSTKNIVYYGQLNNYGYPQSNSGIFIYSDGSYYEGQVKNGRPQGMGRVTNLQNSYSYQGQWKKGMPHGFGKQEIGANVYEGEFYLGKKNGQGKLLYEDGSYYEGYFDNNIIQGVGKFYSKNNYWQGTWKNGYLEGAGRQIIAKQDIKHSNDIQNLKSKKDTSQYKGEFIKGQKSGFGNFKWNKNYEYEGNFSKGQLDGEGTFKFKGKVYAGVWSNGTEVKIHQLIKGVPSVIFSGNIKGDGSIIISNSGLSKKSGIEQLSQLNNKNLKSIEQIQNQESNPRNVM